MSFFLANRAQHDVVVIRSIHFDIVVHGLLSGQEPKAGLAAFLLVQLPLNMRRKLFLTMMGGGKGVIAGGTIISQFVVVVTFVVVAVVWMIDG